MTVLRLQQVDQPALAEFLRNWELQLVTCDPSQPIPGSFWGDDEAGLIGHQLFAWPSTPLHSVFHEASHFICLDESRRRVLHTNAGSDVAEENAVCYLQVLLAGEYVPMGRQRMFSDMDSWGYSFRLGSSKTWFEEDADDARSWLIERGLIDAEGHPIRRLRLDAGHYHRPGIRSNISDEHLATTK